MIEMEERFTKVKQKHELEVCRRLNELFIENEEKESDFNNLQMLYKVSMNNCIAMENDIIELNKELEEKDITLKYVNQVVDSLNEELYIANDIIYNLNK